MNRSRKGEPSSEQVLLRYDQAIELFHFHGLTDLDEDWLKRQADAGRIPCTTVRKRRRFLRSEIERLIASYIDSATGGRRPEKVSYRPSLIRAERIKTRFKN